MASSKGILSLWRFVAIVFACWCLILVYFYRNPKKLVFGTHEKLIRQPHPIVHKVQTDNLVGNSIPTSQKTDVSVVQSPLAKESEDLIHIVFSTDCTFFQDWQSLLVFHSAQTVGQKGKVTRIASGCDDAKQAELIKLYQKLYPSYSVHFTPDYKKDTKTKAKYDFYNKPYGLHHWLKYSSPPVEDNVVVVLIDPDMIFLRPITLELASYPYNIFATPNIKSEDLPKKIGKGVPLAEIYGLGAPWANDRNRFFNRTRICGANSPCLKTSQKFGEDHYSVGPPYMVEKSDLIRLTESWTDFVPRVYEKYPELLAEMFAYSMAAAHQELPHIIVRHLMVSNTDMTEEGWEFVDQLGTKVCEAPVNGIYFPGKPLPNVLHYCQFYRAGEYGFQKRRVKKTIFDCDNPMMAEIPNNLGEVNYKNRDGEIISIGARQAKRNSFMLCTIHQSMNSMLSYYKKMMCSGDSHVNYNQTINVVAKGYW